MGPMGRMALTLNPSPRGRGEKGNHRGLPLQGADDRRGAGPTSDSCERLSYTGEKGLKTMAWWMIGVAVVVGIAGWSVGFRIGFEQGKKRMEWRVKKWARRYGE